MRGCNEARPYREWGEQGFPLQRPSGRERENPRRRAKARPAALKVQLVEVAASWFTATVTSGKGLNAQVGYYEYYDPGFQDIEQSPSCRNTVDPFIPRKEIEVSQDGESKINK